VGDAWRADAAAVVAAAFGLGTALGGLRPVTGGRSHLLWRLSTTTGEWAVKQLNRSREAWWTDAYEIAAEVQNAACARGIAMPRPMPPAHPAATLLADLTIEGEFASFVVHEWCAGAVLADLDVDAGVLPWVGETLAALHSLPVALTPADARLYEPHDPREWVEWLDADGPADFIQAVREFLPDIARAKEVVDEARTRIGPELTPVFTHRDVKPDNVLLTATSPVLVDWDGAGLDFAEWEAIRAALAFSRAPAGWHRHSFDRVIRTYQASSGRRIAPVPASFAGVLRQQLTAAAYLLWRALGHRPATTAEQAAAYDHTLEVLADLRTSLTQIQHWTHWLDNISAPPTAP
jgi:Ser/Thr protein kinase RdoA (MazF antagonist)